MLKLIRSLTRLTYCYLFQVIMQGKANNVHPVTKYRSTSTGLEVVHADIEGPIVNGYIVLGE